MEIDIVYEMSKRIDQLIEAILHLLRFEYLLRCDLVNRDYLKNMRNKILRRRIFIHQNR